MTHVFVSPDAVGDRQVTITGGDVAHIRSVLRMKPGEDLYVSDGAGRDLLCCIRELHEDRVVADILSVRTGSTELDVAVTLYQALPKSGKMETVIQKCVELGVARIVPVETARCIVKLDGAKASAKVRRWQAVSESAAKQSQRSVIPEVSPVMRFEEALRDSESLETRFIPYELSTDPSGLKTLLSGSGSVRSVGIFIGPDGGFEASEIEAAVSCGVRPVTLGRRILRTETAGMALMAAIMLARESGL